MDFDKFLELYLLEGREHLIALTDGLQEGTLLNKEKINSLFRSAHSLKGMASSMGFEVASKLSHTLENLLQKWRDGEKIEEKELEIAIRITDLIAKHFENLEKNRSEGEFKEELTEIINSLQKSEDENKNVSPIKSEQSESISKSQGEEKRTNKLIVNIDPSSTLPAARLMVVFKKISANFNDVQVNPSFEEIQKKSLKSAEFIIKTDEDLSQLAKSLQELPEVSSVNLLELEEEKREPPSQLISFLKIPANSLDDFLFRISHIIFHLSILEKSLPKEVSKKHKFWFETHRSYLYNLYHEILETRLTSFETLVERLKRSARELQHKTKKKFNLVVSGDKEKIDKAILEKLLDPLTHLLRNAVDHGLEDEEERKKRGKNEIGLIKIEIKREGERLTIDFTDDGRGLDFDSIRENALKKGLISMEKASQLSEKDILDLITLPSFSTRKEISDISGRGVGLDVVRATVESLGGTLELSTEKNKGTTFSLIFPSAVSLTEILVFSWDSDFKFSLPLSQIKKLYPLSEFPIEWNQGVKKLRIKDKFLDIIDFRLKAVGRDGIGIGILTKEKEKVLLVNNVHQVEKVVILPLGKPLERIPHLIGCGMLSDGELTYILDGNALIKEEMEAMNVFFSN